MFNADRKTKYSILSSVNRLKPISARTAVEPINKVVQKKILIVDDETIFLMFFTETLKRIYSEKGFTFLSATNLDEAKQHLNQSNGQIRYILTDICFPKQAGASSDEPSGIELIKYAKSINKDVKIIAASCDPFVLPDAKKAGADAVLTKATETLKSLQKLAEEVFR